MTEKVNPLCGFPMTDTPRFMGRPPLNRGSKTITTAVRLTEDTMRRIETVAGPNRMAAFIRRAVEEKLDRSENDQRRAASPDVGDGPNR